MDDLEQDSFADLAPPGPRRGEYVCPLNARIDRCKSCKADIVWTRTEDGKAVPLSLATAQTRDGITYLLSHFSDCEHAKEWSKKGRRR